MDKDALDELQKTTKSRKISQQHKKFQRKEVQYGHRSQAPVFSQADDDDDDDDVTTTKTMLMMVS